MIVLSCFNEGTLLLGPWVFVHAEAPLPAANPCVAENRPEQQPNSPQLRHMTPWAQRQRFWRRSCSLPVNGMKAAHQRSAAQCKGRCNGQRGLDAARTHMPRAFDCFRHHGMVLPTQAVLPTIANRAKLPDVIVQQLIRVANSTCAALLSRGDSKRRGTRT